MSKVYKCCGNCYWHDYFSGACCNGNSPYCADFMNDDQSCSEHELKLPIVEGVFLEMETKKYRVCEVLGVDLEEEFRFGMFNSSSSGSSSCPVELRLHLYGEGEGATRYVSLQFHNGSEWEDVSEYYTSTLFTNIINHPERIWVERDIEDARAVKRLFSWAITVRRSDFNNEVLVEGERTSGGCIIVNVDMASFPSLKPGESVMLTEISEGKVG